MKANIVIIDREGKKAVTTKAFLKKAAIFDSKEFYELENFCKKCPGYTLSAKEIKRKTDKNTATKHLTYENMAYYIRAQKDAEKVMAEFRVEREKSRIQPNPYRHIVAWFKGKFPDYNDYLDFFAKLEAERKKQQEDAMYTVVKAPTTEVPAANN